MRSSSSCFLLQVPCYAMHKQHIPHSTSFTSSFTKIHTKIVSMKRHPRVFSSTPYLFGLQSDKQPCNSFLLDCQTQHPSVTKYTREGRVPRRLVPFLFSQKKIRGNRMNTNRLRTQLYINKRTEQHHQSQGNGKKEHGD